MCTVWRGILSSDGRSVPARNQERPVPRLIVVSERGGEPMLSLPTFLRKIALIHFRHFCLIGGAVVSAAVIAACSGGGSSSTSTANPIPQVTSPGVLTTGTANTTTLKLTIHRGVKTHAAKSGAASKARAVAGSRKPAYVSTSALGLQLTVQSGAATHTIYADISPTSPLCTMNGQIETCAISIPTLGATETFTAMETDRAPTGLAPSTGLGTGFPSGTNILASINQTQDLTAQLGGPVSVGLTLGPVVAFFYDCTPYGSAPAPAPSSTSQNFGVDQSGFNGAGSPTTNVRLVVTQGVAVAGSIQPDFCDPADGFFDYSTTPAPFADVNGSPTPITLTSNVADVTLAPMINNGTAPPTNAFTTTASIPTDAYYANNLYFVVPVHVAATYPSGATNTIVVKNNLTATNPFTGATVNSVFGGTLVYTVVAIAATPTSLSVFTSATQSITGIDQGAASGMGAESSFTAHDGACLSSTGATLATVASAGSISTSNWQQPFTITAGAVPGSCTFSLYDITAETMTQPIQLTIVSI